VAEVWSPSTGGYDVDQKIPEYRRRGDAEIWRLHPYDRTVTIHRRLLDGTYEVSIVSTGVVTLLEFPDVHVNIAALFDFGTSTR
jgi:Uma2 family endonuclease